VEEGPLFYLNKDLPQFSPGFGDFKDVTKLTIDLGGKVTELTREAKTDAPWKFVKPDDLKGRTADPITVQSILSPLSTPHSVTVETEEAKGDELDKRFGLKMPQTEVVVTVTKDGKGTDYKFDFGKDAGPTAVYAKQSQRGMIFTVDKTTLNVLKEPLL